MEDDTKIVEGEIEEIAPPEGTGEAPLIEEEQEEVFETEPEVEEVI